MAPTFADISTADYLLLTTFTRDGRPKPTPVWAATDTGHGDRLLVITAADSWKVKRIRNNPEITLAVCDLRGRPKTEPVTAVATILDRAENGVVYAAINRRYGLIGRGFTLFSKLRGGMRNNVGLELRPAP